MCALLKPPLRELIGELAPMRKDVALSLQAADLFCWHQQRRHAGTANTVDKGRLARLGKTFGWPHEWTAPDLDHFAERWF
jgi:hypothetical protein